MEELDVADILESCSEIRHLDISYCRSLIFSSRKDRVILKMEKWAECSGMDDQILGMVGRMCPQRLHLDVEECRKMTTERVREVVGNCKRLRYLNLSRCNEVSFKIVDWIVSSLASLRRMFSLSIALPAKEWREAFLRRRCLVEASNDCG
ncbi:hypothetical protein Nepgr_009551 [Nepenthes gracilis]|uniref:Uncharacterized protein n=1 Tax=Nepenthes gracilis TaxID=150966 RepID=A0AAD3XKH7_NEPGR|nr:hypothetical protein Nepgr_009551 [Nepenthes gracilis]